jgi:hypothetical protein
MGKMWVRILTRSKVPLQTCVKPPLTANRGEIDDRTADVDNEKDRKVKYGFCGNIRAVRLWRRPRRSGNSQFFAAAVPSNAAVMGPTRKNHATFEVTSELGRDHPNVFPYLKLRHSG